MSSFLTYEKPLITAMIQLPTPDECINKINASIQEGADAIGVQLCKLEREYRTNEDLTRIFKACAGKPIYITSYRKGKSAEYSDEECVELLLRGLDCGATLCDVMGDMFDFGAKYELTTNSTAIKKQMDLIKEIHARGGEVLMSSHTGNALTIEENLTLAKAHAERGADIIKIVNKVDSKEKFPENVASVQKILAETNKKLLYLITGEGELMRYIGPNLGVCMWLCVQKHDALDTPQQPLIRQIKALRENMNIYI